MGTVFISHSSKDINFVVSLATDLRQAGQQVWLAPWNITGQTPFFWDEIQKGIDSCTHFIFIISPNSLDPYGGALKELYYADGLKPPPDLVLIVAPPNSISYAILPMVISPNRYQIHDFTKATYNVMLNRVLVALKLAPAAPQCLRAPTVIEVFTEEDFVPLATLIVRTGQAGYTARRSFCLQIGIDPSNLAFLALTADRDFSVELVAYLYGIGDFAALLRLCDAISKVLKGNLSTQLSTIRMKIVNSH